MGSLSVDLLTEVGQTFLGCISQSRRWLGAGSVVFATPRDYGSVCFHISSFRVVTMLPPLTLITCPWKSVNSYLISSGLGREARKVQGHTYRSVGIGIRAGL